MATETIVATLEPVQGSNEDLVEGLLRRSPLALLHDSPLVLGRNGTTGIMCSEMSRKAAILSWENDQVCLEQGENKRPLAHGDTFCLYKQEYAYRVQLMAASYTGPSSTNAERSTVAAEGAKQHANTLVVSVVNQSEQRSTYFDIEDCTRMGRLFEAFAEREGVDRSSLVFVLPANRIICDSDTPETLGLQDGDTIQSFGPFVNDLVHAILGRRWEEAVTMLSQFDGILPNDHNHPLFGPGGRFVLKCAECQDPPYSFMGKLCRAVDSVVAIVKPIWAPNEVLEEGVLRRPTLALLHDTPLVLGRNPTTGILFFKMSRKAAKLSWEDGRVNLKQGGSKRPLAHGETFCLYKQEYAYRVQLATPVFDDSALSYTDEDTLGLFILDKSEQRTYVKVTTSTILGRVIKAFAERAGVDQSSLVFEWCGRIIENSDTPLTLGLQDGDTIKSPGPFVRDLVRAIRGQRWEEVEVTLSEVDGILPNDHTHPFFGLGGRAILDCATSRDPPDSVMIKLFKALDSAINFGPFVIDLVRAILDQRWEEAETMLSQFDGILPNDHKHPLFGLGGRFVLNCATNRDPPGCFMSKLCKAVESVVAIVKPVQDSNEVMVKGKLRRSTLALLRNTPLVIGRNAKIGICLSRISPTQAILSWEGGGVYLQNREDDYKKRPLEHNETFFLFEDCFYEDCLFPVDRYAYRVELTTGPSLFNAASSTLTAEGGKQHDTLVVSILDQTGQQTHFKTKASTRLGWAFEAYAEREEVDRSSLIFVKRADRIIWDSDTPAMLGLRDGDVVRALPWSDESHANALYSVLNQSELASSSGVHSILDLRPELLWKILSFLYLDEALVLRRTCSRLYNDNNDAFRYSHICSVAGLQLLPSPKEVRLAHQNIDQLVATFVRLAHQNIDQLGAMLQNASFPWKYFDFSSTFIKEVVKYSKTDNGSIIAFLVQDGRFTATESILDKALKKNFQDMAVAMNEIVRAKLQMCATCSVNIGAYTCYKGDGCRHARRFASSSSQYVPPKYCRQCVSKDNRVCIECDDHCEYVCPECFSTGNYHGCEDCGSIIYSHSEMSENRPWFGCFGNGCYRIKCNLCFDFENAFDEETDGWYLADSSEYYCLCPTCNANRVN